MANIPIIAISDLTEQTTAADTDYMVIGGADIKKIKWSAVISLIKAKFGIGDTSKLNTTSKELVGGINELNDKFIYSTAEKQVGIWINGSPLYRKTIIFNTELTAGTNNIPHNISNIGTYFWIDNGASFMYSDANVCYPLTFSQYGANSDAITFAINKTNIVASVQTAWGTRWTKIVSIVYTKA